MRAHRGRAQIQPRKTQMRHGHDRDKIEGNNLPQHCYVRPAPQHEKNRKTQDGAIAVFYEQI